jgi:non-heme chloroperoxidase
MNPFATSPWNPAPADEDLVEQARPGHGIPSQDPSPAAQFSLAPEEAQREANSVLVGGVAIVGAAMGAAIGFAMAGPVGVVPGVALGGVAGALGGEAAGTRVKLEICAARTRPGTLTSIE